MVLSGRKIVHSYGAKNRAACEVRGTKLKRVSQVPGVATRRARRRRTRGQGEEGGKVGRAVAEHGTVNDA